MTTPNDEDGAARDAHLLAALRHAPDREAAPPPHVTARILAAARAAVRPAAPPSWTQRLAAWWRRPALGAAFGTLLAALLVGLLWSTREPPPPAPGPGAAVRAPAPFEAAAPNAETPPARLNEPDAGLAASRDRAVSADAPREAAATPPPRRAAKTEAPRTAEPALQARARADQRAAPRRSDAAEPAVAAPAPAPAADALPRPAPQAAPDAAAAPPSESARQEQAQEQHAANDSKAKRGRAADLRGADAAASRPMPPQVGRLSQAERAAPDPLARLDSSLAAADAALRASWRSADGTPRAVAHGAAQHAWWLELRAATQGRWQRVPAPPATPAWLTLTIDGFDRTRWWLDGEHLVLADVEGGSAWRVPVTQAQRGAWSRAVAGW